MAVIDSDTYAAERSVAWDIISRINVDALPVCKILSSSTLTTWQLLDAISVMEGLLALSKLASFFAPVEDGYSDLMQIIRDDHVIPALAISQEMIAHRSACSIEEFIQKYDEAVQQMCFALGENGEPYLDKRLDRLIKCREDQCQYCAEMKAAAALP